VHVTTMCDAHDRDSDLIRVHIGTGAQPKMGLLKSPIGGIDEFKAIARNVDFSGVDMAEEVEHPFM